MTEILLMSLLFAQIFGFLWWVWSQGPAEAELDIFRWLVYVGAVNEQQDNQPFLFILCLPLAVCQMSMS